MQCGLSHAWNRCGVQSAGVGVAVLYSFSKLVGWAPYHLEGFFSPHLMSSSGI